jgi:3-dehydroquinate synthetase
MGLADGATSQRIVSLVQAYGPLPKVKVEGKRIVRRLLSDKKTVAGTPHFVLARDIGSVRVVNNVSPACVTAAVKQIVRMSRS